MSKSILTNHFRRETDHTLLLLKVAVPVGHAYRSGGRGLRQPGAKGRVRHHWRGSTARELQFM